MAKCIALVIEACNGKDTQTVHVQNRFMILESEAALLFFFMLNIVMNLIHMYVLLK